MVGYIEKPSVGRDSDKFMLRLPDGMRDRLKEVAESNGRSMNAEIVQAISDRLERFDYHKELERHYSENTPEMPPEDWADSPEWEPPSEDFLLEEKQRQFASKIAKATADSVVQRLLAAGWVKP